jgi:hypothetical protein
MSNEDNRGEGGGIQSNDSSNNDHNSVFQIMDRIMRELNKTRKIFVFMFFSMMILPVTAIIIFMYTYDVPKIDRVELKRNIEESNMVSQKLKNQMIQLESLPPSEKEKELQLLRNSQDYKNTVNRIDELSQNELNLISNDPKNIKTKIFLLLLLFYYYKINIVNCQCLVKFKIYINYVCLCQKMTLTKME